MITVTIEVGGASRPVTIDPDELPLGFFADIEEAQETGKFRPLMNAYGAMLGFTPAEMRALTVKQFRAVAQALGRAGKEAATVPNESAPDSA